ncbi:UNVERIFIED_ORG: hypothetical protein J2X74_004184 [Bacillus sp. 1751]|nr:hypothetical protein [Bacillus sp. 1751]
MKSNNVIYDIRKRTCKDFKVFILELKTKKILSYSYLIKCTKVSTLQRLILAEDVK